MEYIMAGILLFVSSVAFAQQRPTTLASLIAQGFELKAMALDARFPAFFLQKRVTAWWCTSTATSMVYGPQVSKAQCELIHE